MISRAQRTVFSEWWWTVDRLMIGAVLALMLIGIVLLLAASPPVVSIWRPPRNGARPVKRLFTAPNAKSATSVTPTDTGSAVRMLPSTR